MKTCVPRLVSTLLAVLALSLMLACKNIPFFRKGFTLEIEPMAGQTSQLQELYLIVSADRDVAEPLRSGDLAQLLEENKIDNQYTSFRQYRPTEDRSWELEFKANDSGLVTYEVKESILEVLVSKKIGGSQGIQFKVVVLGLFGSAGFKQVTIGQSTLDSGEDGRVEVAAASFNLTGPE